MFTRVDNAVNTSKFSIYCSYEKSDRNLHFNQSHARDWDHIFIINFHSWFKNRSADMFTPLLKWTLMRWKNSAGLKFKVILN